MHMIGFLCFLFVGMTMLNRFAEGAMIAGDEISIMNTMTITRDQSVFQLFTVPVLNTDFFFTGIPKLIQWDYSFFGGNAAIFQYFLYSLTIALTFLLFTVIIGLVSQYFSRR